MRTRIGIAIDLSLPTAVFNDAEPELLPKALSRIIRAVALPCVVALSLPVALHWQTIRAALIPTAIACPSCRIEFQVEAVLGDTSGPGSFGARPLEARRDSKGNYVVIADGLPQVFDSAGKYVRTLGRIGDGPGEMRRPLRTLVLPGDSLLVYEPGSLELFAPNGWPARSMKGVGSISGWANTYDGRILLQARVATRGGAARPLHVMTTEGVIERSFGDSVAGFEYFTPTPDGGIWVSWMNSYNLVKLDKSGRVAARLTRNVSWLPRTRPRPDPTKPPPTAMTNIISDRNGLLWRVALVPGPRWQEGMPIPDANGMTNPRKIAFELLQNGLLEVVDPVARHVVASAPFPGYIARFIDESRFISPFEDTDGVIRARIWRFTLVRKVP